MTGKNTDQLDRKSGVVLTKAEGWRLSGPAALPKLPGSSASFCTDSDWDRVGVVSLGITLRGLRM